MDVSEVPQVYDVHMTGGEIRQLAEELSGSQSDAGRSFLVIASKIGVWREPVGETVSTYPQAIETDLEVGPWTARE